MEFKTQYDARDRVFTDPGSPEHITPVTMTKKDVLSLRNLAVKICMTIFSPMQKAVISTFS